MQLFTIVALALAAQTPVPADKPVSVVLSNDWKVGEKAQYMLTRRREDFQGTKPARVSAVQTPVEVEVTDRRTDGYTMRWTFGRGELIEAIPEPKFFEADQARVQEGLTFAFKTDATGSPTELFEPLEAEASASRAAARLKESLVKAGSQPEDMRWIDLIGANCSGKMYHDSLLREPRLVYMPSGSNLVLGERRAYEDRLPNPFGGAPLPSRAWLELRTLRADVNEVVIEWRNSVDVDKAGPALDAAIREQARARGRPLPDEVKVSLGALEDAATWIYDTKTGRPKSLVTTRTSVVQDTRRVETITFELSSSPPK